MAKIKEKDLVIGDEYWIEKGKAARGIYVGQFDNNVLFYATFNNGSFNQDEEGIIGLAGVLPNTEYEEVE